VVVLGLATPILWLIVGRLLPPSDATLAYVEAGPAGGIVLTRVVNGGLNAGDEVVAINGRPVPMLLSAGLERPPRKGDVLVYTVIRDQGADPTVAAAWLTASTRS
jgi:hypothetical protein